MSSYTKKSLLYVGALVLLSALILLFRSDAFQERMAWGAAVDRGTSRAYREYCSNWRTSDRVADAVAAWERALTNEYNAIMWEFPHAVEEFISGHPEFRETDIRRVQYEKVVRDGSYEVLKRYLECLASGDPRREEVRKLIDERALSEIKPALDNDDYKELARLADKYSDWSGRSTWIDGRIQTARENSARGEWERRSLSSSWSEIDLRLFHNKYRETSYATLASQRIAALYSDFNFVRRKGSLQAYANFVHNNPRSPQYSEAWGCIGDELEQYVFRRKSLGSNEALVKSLLAECKCQRPYSGAFYETTGYYSSPLKIITPTYGSDDYYVKLVNNGTGRSYGVYVRSGATVEVRVPDGTYSVRYATGRQWYGTRLLFGLNASYSKASGNFTFSNGSGYSLTLQKVAHGNLHTTPMSASDF